MNCSLIDNKKTTRIIAKTLCNKIEPLILVEAFLNAIQPIKYLNEKKVDFIFLDIQMQNFSGIAYIKTLKHPGKISITPFDPQFEIEGFENDFIIIYSLKRTKLKRFRKVVKNSQIQFSDKNHADREKELSLKNDFYVNVDKRFIKIELPSFLERKNQALNNYSHIFSHDLKSPLLYMHALTKWMKEDYAEDLVEEKRQTIDFIRENVEQKSRLILGVLEYSVIDEVGKERYEVDLNVLIDEFTAHLNNTKYMENLTSVNYLN